MTCVRLLEILPVVFERLWPSWIKLSGSFGMSDIAFDFSWLHDLVDWGKSKLKVVIVYWRRTVGSLLKLLKGSCNTSAALTIRTIEDLLSCGEHFFSLLLFVNKDKCLLFSCLFVIIIINISNMVCFHTQIMSLWMN